jgi:hypothetical protein
VKLEEELPVVTDRPVVVSTLPELCEPTCARGRTETGLRELPDEVVVDSLENVVEPLVTIVGVWVVVVDVCVPVITVGPVVVTEVSRREPATICRFRTTISPEALITLPVDAS